MNILFAVWNLDSADHSMFFVALRSQIYEECPASWTFGLVRAPLLLIRNVLSARCLLAMTRRFVLLLDVLGGPLRQRLVQSRADAPV
jgi:hypothetical protein